MMSTHENGPRIDDWLEATLRTTAAGHRDDYIDDDGFTARVLDALPPPATLPAWRKPVVAMLWVAAGLGAAVALPGTLTDVVREVMRIIGGHPVSLPGIATGIAALAAASWVAVGYTLRRS